MPRLLIAIGNPLRHDDGVARAISGTGWQRLELMQLTPEIAADLAGFDRVMFLDAEHREGTGIEIQPVTEAGREPLTHHSTPAGVVALARALYGFSGEAHLCRIPVTDFGYGETLSPHAEAMAARASELLSSF